MNRGGASLPSLSLQEKPYKSLFSSRYLLIIVRYLMRISSPTQDQYFVQYFTMKNITKKHICSTYSGEKKTFCSYKISAKFNQKMTFKFMKAWKYFKLTTVKKKYGLYRALRQFEWFRWTKTQTKLLLTYLISPVGQGHR